MELPKNVINPFSENFLIAWDLWKSYMLESHQFNYRGVISEQMALKRLVDVSEGDEQKAERIIHQSISREWKDFFELRQPSVNGKSRAKKQSTSEQPNESLRERVIRATNKKFGNGEQEGDGTHLKAV